MSAHHPRSPLGAFAALLLGAALVPLPAEAQSAAPEAGPPRPLTVGRAVADSLAPGAIHAFALDLSQDRFVLGAVEQRTVDVVVTVTGPDGSRVARFDAPSAGPERFSFDAEAPGTYRLEVTGDDDGAGRYELLVERVEPVAHDAAARLAQIVAPLDRPDTPGGVVGIVEDGELVLARPFGQASLAYDVPFTVRTPTNIGSVTKQLTSFAVALLADRGRLSLDDDVRTHLPELKDFGTPVSLRHLMTHTSGYREFLNLLAMGGRRLDYDYVDRGELVDIVARQPELQNAPGDEWNYNNTGYGLLARVVEVVGGKPFPEWMRENVFEPLGMDRTVVRADPRAVVPGRSMGYVDGDLGFAEATDLGGAVGAGGVYTTVEDLASWMGHLLEPRLGSPEIVEWMTTPYVLNDGDTTSYGLGLGIGEERGLRRISHGGADVAHRATFAFFPELDAGYIVLSNYGSLPGSMVADVADLFFEMQGVEAPAAVAAADDDFEPDDFDPSDFDAYAGKFALDESPNVVFSFRRDGDDFFAGVNGQDELPLVPTSDSTFAVEGANARVTFHRTGSGPVETVTVHQSGDRSATRVRDPASDEAPLADYVGRYFSDEVEAYYDVVVDADGELEVRHRRLDAFGLDRVREDRFGGGFPLVEVTFERDESGRVTGFRASNGRTRGVWFERLGGVGRH